MPKLPRRLSSDAPPATIRRAITEIYSRPDVVRAFEQNDATELSAFSALALNDLADALDMPSVKLMIWETLATVLAVHDRPLGAEMREFLTKHAEEIRPELRAKLLRPDPRPH
jgi:hypothetical protein